MSPPGKLTVPRLARAARDRIQRSIWSKAQQGDRYLAGEQDIVEAAKKLPADKLLGVPLFFSTAIPLLFGYAARDERQSAHILLVVFLTVYLIFPLVYLVLRGLGVSLWVRFAVLLVLALTSGATSGFDEQGGWWWSLAWVVLFAILLLGAVRWLKANRVARRRRSDPSRPLADPLFWLGVLSVAGMGLLWLWPRDVFDRGRATFAMSSVVEASGRLVERARAAQERDYTRQLLVQGGYISPVLDTVGQKRLMNKRQLLTGMLRDSLTEYLRRVDPSALRQKAGGDSVRAAAERDRLLRTDSAAWIGQGIARLAIVSDSAAGILDEAGSVKLVLVGGRADVRPSVRRDTFLSEETGYRAKREVIFQQLSEMHHLRVDFAQERIKDLILDVRDKGRLILGCALLLVLGGYYYEAKRPRSRNPLRKSTYRLGVALIVVLGVPLFRDVDTSEIDPTQPLQSFILSNWYLPGALTPQAFFLGEGSSYRASTTGSTRSAVNLPGIGSPGGGGSTSGGDPAGGDPAGGDPAGGDPAGGDPAGGDPAGGDPGGGVAVPETAGPLVLSPQDSLLVERVVQRVNLSNESRWQPLQSRVDLLYRELIGDP